MKRFIRYLYEYEQGKRIRNAGFVKIEAGNEETIVNMQGKGFHNGNERKLVLYLFYEENGKIIGIRQAEVNLVTPVLSQRLTYTVNDVGKPENFAKIKGIIVETASGKRLAATWDDRPVDVSRMEEYVEEDLLSDNLQADDSQAGDLQASDLQASDLQAGLEESIAGRNAPEASQTRPDRVEAGLEETKAGRNAPEASQARPDRVEAGREQTKAGRSAPESTKHAPHPQRPEQQYPQRPEQQYPQRPEQQQAYDNGRTIKKIRRQDLARLPRCEWKLANNQFLIYGYNNYHHLVWIQDGNVLKIGVPGIYHIKEAKVAETFGFGEFLSVTELDISLEPEERHQDEPFGYWCRMVKCKETIYADYRRKIHERSNQTGEESICNRRGSDRMCYRS